MTLDNWKTVSELVHNLITSAAVILGGGWVLRRFALQRERFSPIEFSLDLRVLGKCGGRLLVEPAAVVMNRGSVRHWLIDFRFDLLYLPIGAMPVDGDQSINFQTRFQSLIKQREWLPGTNSFLDPGATQRFSYVIMVPAETAFVLLYSRFKYRDSASAFHTSQRAFPIVAEAGEFEDS